MQKMGSALIFIILGLIVISFPLIGVIPLSLITGFIVLFLGIGLLLAGITDMSISATMGIAEIVLGIIALILGIGFVFNPGLFSFVASLIVYLAGIFLIITGLIAVISKTVGNRWYGLVPLILGIIYILVGSLIANPQYLGILIGLWLLIMGILMLFEKE
ncbi:MAG: DUF308 domain-containing protein [Methanobacterium sp.]|uniref:DUF308 domain-containing protein n=1 Tax=Methanobacterium sp. TaxID=2164 RepID=UPI003D64D5BE|nr:DUF308 domain-containing protein [Methanobacterium sp.]